MVTLALTSRRRAGAARPRFTPDTLAFLRALSRNNRREWFHARKERYEQVVRAPMLAVIDQLGEDLPAFAPDLVASPRVSMYRIYRDTRFSADKTPLKTSVGAIFPHRLLPKHEGAGLYFEVGPRHVWFGGGMYMPSTSRLQMVREHVALHHRRLRTIVESRAFERTFGALGGELLQRVPRGFPKDHPAAEFLKHRQFLAGCERPAAFAASPGFYRTILAAFRTIAPLVEFLNQPLVSGAGAGLGRREWPSTDR